MNMFLTNKTRLKIKDIVKRISLDEPVALEERIYVEKFAKHNSTIWTCLLYTSPSPRDDELSRMPSSA